MQIVKDLGGGSIGVKSISVPAISWIQDKEGVSASVRENRYIQGGRIEPTYIEFSLALGITQPGKALVRSIWNCITTTPDHTQNTVTSSFSFRGGKQNKRDADINEYPTYFKRWYHKYYKGNQRGNATKGELRELYEDWLNMGSPKVK